jgi:hypothetical protein
MAWAPKGNIRGPQGIAGPPGSAGPGVPAGGAQGALLVKNSASDYDTEWDGPNVVTLPAASPAGITFAATPRMAGLGMQITARRSGFLVVAFSGGGFNSAANAGYSVRMRYGTGTPPANNALVIGNVFGPVVENNLMVANSIQAFAVQSGTSQFALATPIWFDLEIAVFVGGTATLRFVSGTVFEL